MNIQSNSRIIPTPAAQVSPRSEVVTLQQAHDELRAATADLVAAIAETETRFEPACISPSPETDVRPPCPPITSSVIGHALIDQTSIVKGAIERLHSLNRRCAI